MDENVISIKLVSGKELICCTTNHRVDFGILKYPGKIPRKVFQIETTPGKKIKRSHQLTVTRCIEINWIPSNGIIFSPLFHTTPQFNNNSYGMELSIHSNDVMALNWIINENISMNYRQAVGLINPAQISIINHTDKPQ